MADSRLTDLTAQSVLAVDDVLYSVDVSDTADNAAGSSRKLPIDRLLGFQGLTPGGRLTLESGVPISTSNQTAKSTLYYTPYLHDWVRLYDGTRPKLYQFTECSLSLTMTSGKNYDVFLYDNSGTLTMELSAAWTNDTTRADSLAWQAGFGWVKSGDATRLHLGTIRASDTNQTELVFGGNDTAARCFLWNRYNRKLAAFSWRDTTDSWTYTTATWRQKRASANNQFSFVCGESGQALLADASALSAQNTRNGRAAAFGYDTTTAFDSSGWPAYALLADDVQMLYGLKKTVGLGYHYIAEMEYAIASGTCTWYGDGASGTWFHAGANAAWEF